MTPIEKLKKLSKFVCEKCFRLQNIPLNGLGIDYSICQTCPIHQLINELMEEMK